MWSFCFRSHPSGKYVPPTDQTLQSPESHPSSLSFWAPTTLRANRHLPQDQKSPLSARSVSGLQPISAWGLHKLTFISSSCYCCEWNNELINIAVGLDFWFAISSQHLLTFSKLGVLIILISIMKFNKLIDIIIINTICIFIVLLLIIIIMLFLNILMIYYCCCGLSEIIFQNTSYFNNNSNINSLLL